MGGGWVGYPRKRRGLIRESFREEPEKILKAETDNVGGSGLMRVGGGKNKEGGGSTAGESSAAGRTGRLRMTRNIFRKKGGE